MTVPRPIAGALAGCFATAPMTGAMLLMQQVLPPQQRYALPPEIITAISAIKTGHFDRALQSRKRKVYTLLMHFGFGATAGAVYGLLPSGFKLPAPLRGVIFALVVWASSYLGWLPAAGLYQPATQQPARRNLLMIAAHLVWGSVLGLLTALLVAGKKEESMQEQKSKELKGQPGRPSMSPGDEAPAGTPGTGEDVCPRCGGKGQRDGQVCDYCQGSGKVIKAIGGA